MVDTASTGGLATIRTRIGANRRVQARLQRRSATVATDLGWEHVASVPLTTEGFDTPPSLTAAWLGQLELPEPVAPRRPGADPQWRVTIEETEWLDADQVNEAVKSHTPQPLLPRVVYLGHLKL